MAPNRLLTSLKQRAPGTNTRFPISPRLNALVSSDRDLPLDATAKSYFYTSDGKAKAKEIRLFAPKGEEPFIAEVEEKFDKLDLRVAAKIFAVARSRARLRQQAPSSS